jgi:hypothetical protein
LNASQQETVLAEVFGRLWIFLLPLILSAWASQLCRQNADMIRFACAGESVGNEYTKFEEP